jgi:uncharacterized lipoprotein NlpE involved in copper resistance
MKKSAWTLLVVGVILAGCNDEVKEKPAATAAAAAPAAGTASSAPAAAVAASSAKAGGQGVRGHLHLEPVSSDKFKLGPQSGGSK